MTDERKLQERIDELQAVNTRLVEELRRSDRRQMVREFFVVAGQRRPERVNEATPEEFRLGVRLVAEEFFELLDAAFKSAFPGHSSDHLEHLRAAVAEFVDGAEISVDLPDLVDATVDLDYVVEGLRVRLGVDVRPIWAAVHAANMAKMGGPKRADGKLQKPEGWRPADVAGLLREQERSK